MIQALSKALAGWPDIALSAVLIGIGSFLIVAGLFFHRVAKLPIALWAIA